MKKFQKIFMGVEGIVYLIIFGIIVYHMCNFRYTKIVHWSGFLLFTGVGILLPAAAYLSSLLLFNKGKNAAGRIISILLTPYIIITCICGIFLSLGEVTCSATTDLTYYKQYDKEVIKMLDRYGDIFPQIDENGMTVTEYHYEYIRTLFDDNFSIYVCTQYEDVENMDKKVDELKEGFGVTVLKEDKMQKKYQYGDCVIDYNSNAKEIVYQLVM